MSKLKGVIHLPALSSFVDGPTLHEILHLYANFDIPTQEIIGEDENGDPISGAFAPHLGFTTTGKGQTISFSGDTDINFSYGGQLGGFSVDELIVIEEPGSDNVGVWKVNGGFGLFANEGNSIPYEDL